MKFFEPGAANSGTRAYGIYSAIVGPNSYHRTEAEFAGSGHDFDNAIRNLWHMIAQVFTDKAARIRGCIHEENLELRSNIYNRELQNILHPSAKTIEVVKFARNSKCRNPKEASFLSGKQEARNPGNAAELMKETKPT